MKWFVWFQQLGQKKKKAQFKQYEDMCKWVLRFPEGNETGLRIISIRGRSK